MKKGERLPFTRTQKWWELGSITVLVFWAAYLLRVWDQIPATVPTHFGLTGQINSYGGKESLLVLPAAAARNVAKNLRQYHLWSILLALASSIAGLLTSYYVGCSTGATISLYLALCFAVTFLLRRRH